MSDIGLLNTSFANEIKSVPLYAVFCIEAKEDTIR